MASTTEEIVVRAPSRLHFGMFSFGAADERSFGGVGCAIDSPGLELRVAPANRFRCEGPLSERVEQFARRMAASQGLQRPPPCCVRVSQAPPEHVGLGTGTQLGLAVAAGLSAFCGWPEGDPVHWARAVGRGARSAIGVYAFHRGGLLVESGKREAEEISPLAARVELPEVWRFLLVRPREGLGLSGAAERDAFAGLPAPPRDVTAELCRKVLLELLPAARQADFEEFGESLYAFGRLAGSCFAARQEGEYASRQTADWVAALRRLGSRGVGQSSWGPTVFALCESQASAEQLAREVGRRPLFQNAVTDIAAPDNRGAEVIR